MADTIKLDQEARYAVKGWGGNAFFIYGFPKVWEPAISFGECDDPSCVCHDGAESEHEYDTGEGEWVEQDESCGRVVVVMVGDDTKRTVDIEDLTKLGDLDYCAECGQIGCTHDGRERS